MEYIGIGICIVAVIAAGVILYLKSAKKQEESVGVVNANVSTSSRETLVESDTPSGLTIQMEMLPADSIGDESRLVEITESKVLAHINSLVLGLAQAENAVNNAVQASNREVLYRAILPVGEKLSHSHTLEGAFKEMYYGAKGIKGHTDWVPVEARKGTAVVANTAVAAIGVASMVVGQYYMTQINAELGVISEGISQIRDFQDNEYRSRVFSLMAHVKKIADFQTEILENAELRLTKISQIDSLEEECTQLLGQANLTLVGFTKKNNLDYKEYEKTLSNAQKWFMYQKSLLDILYKISDLRYTLHLGVISREQCVALLPTYIKQVSDTQERLTAWHKETTERLGIETDEIRRKRVGFDGVIHFIPGLFNDDLNFRSIEEKTAKMITTQASGHKESYHVETSELFAEDVQLIFKDGKIYYLPGSKAE